MKICYLGDAPSPHVQKFAEYFSKIGNEIHIISLRKADYKNATVHLIPRRTPFEDLNYLLSFPWLRRTIKSTDPDLLHAHFLTSFGLLGALAAFRPYILTVWGSDLLVTPKKSLVHKWLLKFTIKKADLIFAVADFMKRELISYGAPAEKILISPMGVNLESFNDHGREFKEKGEHRLLSIRALIKNSNIDVIIKSVGILRDKGIKVLLIIANRGPEEQYLRRMTNELELNGRTNFIGFVEHSNVSEYFKSSDIYLSVTTSDGAPVTLLEAMACGVFPIVSDISANGEWIKNGVNGFLVPLGDPVALADKISLAIKDKNFREKAAKINRNLVKRRGELKKTMEFVRGQYEFLINSNKHACKSSRLGT